MTHLKRITVAPAEVTPDAITGIIAAILDLFSRVSALLDKA